MWLKKRHLCRFFTVTIKKNLCYKKKHKNIFSNTGHLIKKKRH